MALPAPPPTPARSPAPAPRPRTAPSAPRYPPDASASPTASPTGGPASRSPRAGARSGGPPRRRAAPGGGRASRGRVGDVDDCSVLRNGRAGRADTRFTRSRPAEQRSILLLGDERRTQCLEPPQQRGLRSDAQRGARRRSPPVDSGKFHIFPQKLLLLFYPFDLNANKYLLRLLFEQLQLTHLMSSLMILLAETA